MKTDTDKKIAAHHLQRKALVYVRQSTMKQVRENTASTARQYQLVDTAIALGWHPDLIHVIDEDLGQSARSATHRQGVVKHVNRQGIAFPTRPIKGPHQGELRWGPLASGLALRILHNPRYAGAYAYGRTELRKGP